MTKSAVSEDILTHQEKGVKSDNIQIPWTNYTPQRHHKKKISIPGSQQRGAVLETRQYFQTDSLHIIKTKQYVLLAIIYGSQTWSLDQQLTTENWSKSNGEENVKFKANG